MLEHKNIAYFVGIGGIGMSALARYFLLKGYTVYGYDANSSENTRMLESLGAYIHFDETTSYIEKIVSTFGKNSLLVVYTPAISTSSPIIQWLNKQHVHIYKRSEVLGYICRSYKALAVAGTHGKTTISSLLAHIFYQSNFSCNAFLGGIVKNYQSNFLYSPQSSWVVVEADEYDRSFLHLLPEASVITAVDPDHLDIYHSYDALKQAYQDYIYKIKNDGKLLLKKSIDNLFDTHHLNMSTYSVDDSEADCYISNIRNEQGYYRFNVHTPWGTIIDMKPGITGWYNVENVLAASSMALWLGLSIEEIKSAVESFTGVKRRFDVIVNNAKHIYIDDYAHHPEEIKAFIGSVRGVFAQMPITGIFQPHLYSRTKDLADEFAQALSLLDDLCLLPIYPARELPIEGVDSTLIFNKATLPSKELIEPSHLLEWIKQKNPRLLVTMGAGNIDQWVEPIKRLLNED